MSPTQNPPPQNAISVRTSSFNFPIEAANSHVVQTQSVVNPAGRQSVPSNSKQPSSGSQLGGAMMPSSSSASQPQQNLRTVPNKIAGSKATPQASNSAFASNLQSLTEQDLNTYKNQLSSLNELFLQ